MIVSAAFAKLNRTLTAPSVSSYCNSGSTNSEFLHDHAYELHYRSFKHRILVSSLQVRILLQDICAWLRYAATTKGVGRHIWDVPFSWINDYIKVSR
jgi:hypothetical protein